MSLLNTKDAVSKIKGLLPRSAESFYEIGTVLKTVHDQIATFTDSKKKELARAEFKIMVAKDLPFGEIVARKFIAIASSAGISANLDIVPNAYNTMYSLKDVTVEDFKKLRSKGLNSMSTAKDVSAFKVELYGKTTKKETKAAQQTVANLSSANKKKAQTMKKLNKLGAKVTEVSEDHAFPSIYLTVNASAMSVITKKKLSDLIAYVNKLNFSSESGVTVENTINPNILSDEPLKQTA